MDPKRFKMDFKRFEEIITCGVCSESFNEGNRCPRMLSCGHTFCHSCLEKTLVQSPTCPTCIEQISFQAAELIPVNFVAKNLISLTKREDTGSSKPQSDLPEGSCSTTSGKLESEGYCAEHCNHKELRCMDCELWICGICSTLSHKTCRTLLAKKAYKELKGLVALKVENELKILEKMDRGIEKFIHLNEEEEKELIDKIRKKENELSECKKRIENFHLLKSENLELCENLRQLQTDAKNSIDDNEVSETINKMDELLDQGKRLVSQCKSLDVYDWSSFQSSVQDLSKLCKSKPVFVVEKENEKLYGKITVMECQVWISCLQPEKPRALFPFKELLKEFTTSTALPKKVFLKLTPADGSSLEDIDLVIETVGDSARVRNFILLCSALKGGSYKGRRLVNQEEYYLSGSNNYSCYEINSFPANVVEGIDADKRTINQSIGMVQGNLNDSGFSIITKVSSDRAIHSIFITKVRHSSCSSYQIGNIVCGLQKLTGITAQSLIIKDCGLVI